MICGWWLSLSRCSRPRPPESLKHGEGETEVVRIVRRSARGILIDDEERLILIKRTRPGEAAYWTAPGGGVDPTDASPADALRRELDEELGASVEGCEQVFLFSSPAADGVAVQHFFVCRLTRLDLEARHGPEFEEAGRGSYDVDRVALDDGSLDAIDLKPAPLKEFILANRTALLDAMAAPAT
jgi:ADP-ribose pyrophosphatase YjhB (NUDIX family)